MGEVIKVMEGGDIKADRESWEETVIHDEVFPPIVVDQPKSNTEIMLVKNLHFNV